MSRPPGPHRPADPVRTLLHRHRELCERAVDPLEIAAALEARGITDRTAARYRHRDVFSLAEELYARTPRADGPLDEPLTAPPAPAPPAGPDAPRRRGARWARATRVALLPLLPGALCAATLYVPHAPAPVGSAPPSVRIAATAVGALLVLLSAWLCLRATVPSGTAPTRATVLGSCWLLGYALAGDRLLAWCLGDGVRAAPLPAERWTPLALALAVAPAVWCARWFAARARRRLRTSRDLAEFAARTRPLLAAAVTLFTAALSAVVTAAHLALDGAALPDPLPLAAVTALGTLLFTAVLLTAHGFPAAAARGLAVACVLEAAALAAASAARRPGAAHLGRPVEALVDAWGPAAVPAAACTAAALVLLASAAGSLTAASAHRRDGP